MGKSGKQIKRNVVSLISQCESVISVKKLVAALVTILAISLSLLTTSPAANLEIRQRVHVYEMPFAQVISTETFVISSASKQVRVKAAIPEKPAQPDPDPLAHFTNPITVHFKIDSAEISHEERTKLLSQLQEFEVPQNGPLTATGFTCTMGRAAFNIWLSEERAKAVAGLLEKEGYSVIGIEGKGTSDLISDHYHPSNRRVEVTPFETTSASTVQSQFSTKEETQ